jgi:hypothetical protein
MLILSEQQRTELMKIILEIAKERMKEVNHLDVGNYCSEIFSKIIKVIEQQ